MPLITFMIMSRVTIETLTRVKVEEVNENSKKKKKKKTTRIISAA